MKSEMNMKNENEFLSEMKMNIVIQNEISNWNSHWNTLYSPKEEMKYVLFTTNYII